MSTPAERSAYGRGYYAGMKNGARWRDKLLALAKKFRMMAVLPSTAQRDCSTCDRWRRGGEGCHWGVCAGSTWGVFEYSVEPRMWIDATNYEHTKQLEALRPRIFTSEDFSCANWLPKEPTS